MCIRDRGGGTEGELWTQIVTDVAGMTQVIPSKTIGASYGAALLAAQLENDVCIDDWNPPAGVLTPDESTASDYGDLYRLYLDLYPASSFSLMFAVERTPQRRGSPMLTGLPGDRCDGNGCDGRILGAPRWSAGIGGQGVDDLAAGGVQV